MLVEVVLVFLGITGAFWVDHWNDGRQEARRETELLRQIAVELTSDTTDLGQNLRSNALARIARDSVLAWLDGDQPFDSATAIDSFTLL